MKVFIVLLFVCAATACMASNVEHGCRAWAVLVFLSVTAFLLALLQVHTVANAPRRDR